MVSLQDYVGREQSYVKHVFLERYLERLVHKTASSFPEIVYVDGFAGPWQSANERFEDTSFGIALNALRRAKASWKAQQRDVRMSTFLVEREPTAYQHLAGVARQYPDIAITPYNDDFLAVLPTLLDAIPANAFAFFLIDPKGWSVPLRGLQRLLARPRSEVVFTFMFATAECVVTAAGYEIGPGDRQLLGSVQGEVHHLLSADNRSLLTIRGPSRQKIASEQRTTMRLSGCIPLR